MFIAKNRIWLHDVDIAGRLYFPRQFRLVHEAIEDFFESESMPFKEFFERDDYLFVVVKCEANYYAPLVIGDRVEIHVSTESIGSSSFTLNYEIFKEDGTKTGSAKTILVSLNKQTQEKIPNPPELTAVLSKYL